MRNNVQLEIHPQNKIPNTKSFDNDKTAKKDPNINNDDKTVKKNPNNNESPKTSKLSNLKNLM